MNNCFSFFLFLSVSFNNDLNNSTVNYNGNDSNRNEYDDIMNQ